MEAAFSPIAPLLNRQFLHRCAYAVLLVLLFLLPFELPVAEALHGVVYPLVGDLYRALLIGSLLLPCVVIFFLTTPGRALVDESAHYSYWALSGLFAAVGVIGVLDTSFFQQGNLGLSLQQLLLGYVAPALTCGAILACRSTGRRGAWLALYSGWVAFLLVSFVLLAYSWQRAIATDPVFARASFGQRLFFWRYTFGGSNLYSIFVGNANKTSNSVLIFLLLGHRLLGVGDPGAGRWTRRLYLTFGLCSVTTLVVLFSRAALMLLPLVAYLGGFWRSIGRRAKQVAVLALLASAFFAWNSYYSALNYLFTATNVWGESEGALGTFNERLTQWHELSGYLGEHPAALVKGMGTAGYGERFFHSDFAETHNMFFDVLSESGVWGLSLLIGVLLMALAMAVAHWFHRRDFLPLFGLACLLMLMVREYAVSYLYVTSLGGMCFTAVFSLLPPDRGFYLWRRS